MANAPVPRRAGALRSDGRRAGGHAWWRWNATQTRLPARASRPRWIPGRDAPAAGGTPAPVLCRSWRGLIPFHEDFGPIERAQDPIERERLGVLPQPMKSRLRRCAGENRLKCAENLRPGPAEGPRHVLSWRPSALCRPDQALCVACGSSNERQSGNACSPELSKSVNGDWRLQGLGPSRRVHFSIPRRGLCSNWSSCAPRGESWIPQNPLTRKIESRTHGPQQFKGNYH